MRCFLIAVTALMLFASGAAQAKIAITVDKNAQLMTVAVDGVERYRWPVSSGLPSYETPNGSFKTFRMEQDHYSKEFDEAPMPHAIFFTKLGHAIHGTDSVNRLGSPASHGCVRLSRANAATLYALVEKDGVLNATVTLTGSSQVALARNPRPRANTAVARGEPAPQYNSAGDPVVLAPRPGVPGQVAPLVGHAGTAASSGRRRLHLSGRRLFQRGALSGAAQPAPLWRAGPSAARAILLQSRLRAAIRPAGLLPAADLLSAARTVHLSGLTRIGTRPTEMKEAANRGGL